MSIDHLLDNIYIFFFIIAFCFLLILSYYLKLRNLGLRFITFVIILVIIFNPIVNSTDKELKNDIVIIVSDFTKSIKETSKENKVKIVKQNLNDQLKKFNNLNVLNINVLEEKENTSLEIDNYGTLIHKSITRSLNNINIDRVSGIIVLTDGQIHDMQNFNTISKSIPIHFMIIGNKQEKDQFLLAENIPKYVLLGNNLEFNVEIISNIGESKVKTSFFLDGSLIKTMSLIPNKAHKISLPLKHAGENILDIKINNNSKEISFLNNSITQVVNGVHDRLRVMLISGEPNMGLRNLRNILNSDPSIELIHFTILRPPTKRDLTPVKELSLIPFPTQELFAADISKFSLIIFDQYGLQGILPPKYLDNITRFVIEGGALLDIAGKKYVSEESLTYSPIKKILPTKPLSDFQSNGFKPLLTEIGERHPITNKIKDNYNNNNNEWGNWFSFTKSSIISGKKLMHFDNYPILVVDKVGQGRVAQILSNQSWVWQKSEKNRGPLIALIRNTIQWLLKNPRMEENFIQFKKNNKQVLVQLNSLKSGDVSSQITTPSNKKIKMVLKDNKKGMLEGTFISDEKGKFKITFNEKEKFIHIGEKNKIELLDIRSSDKTIKEYINKKHENSDLITIFWEEEGIPEVVRVYNNKVINGKKWIGILKKNVVKEGASVKKEFFKWYLIFFLLVSFLFLSWYREGKE